jgi:hypothetical protein
MIRPMLSLATSALAAVTIGFPAMAARPATLDPLQPQQVGAVVYDREDYAGTSAPLGPGARSAPFDAIGSIQVLDGYSVAACTGARGRGTCRPLSGSTPDLGQLFDDLVTWVRVRPQPQSTTTTTTAPTTTRPTSTTTTAPSVPPTTRAPSTTTTAPSTTTTRAPAAAPPTTVLDRTPPPTTAPATTTVPETETTTETAPATTTTTTPSTTTVAETTTSETTTSETTTSSTTTSSTTTTTNDDGSITVSAAGAPPPDRPLPVAAAPTDGADRGWLLPTIAGVSLGALALCALLLAGRLGRLRPR